MNRLHALIISLFLGVTGVVGAIAATQTMKLGVSSAAPAQTDRAALRSRAKKLNAWAKSLNETLAKRPPALPAVPRFGPVATPTYRASAVPISAVPIAAAVAVPASAKPAPRAVRLAKLPSQAHTRDARPATKTVPPKPTDSPGSEPPPTTATPTEPGPTIETVPATPAPTSAPAPTTTSGGSSSGSQGGGGEPPEPPEPGDD